MKADLFTEVACAECGKAFLRNTSQCARWEKRGWRMFCSVQCSSAAALKSVKRCGICDTPSSVKAERVRANGLINMRIRRGTLTRPNKCEQCGAVGRVDAHHQDYAQPDNVEWLCRSCHMKRHWKPQSDKRQVT